jgi:hypothetical protein
MEQVHPQNLAECPHAVKSNDEVRMKSMIGLLVVVVICLLAYKYYFQTCANHQYCRRKE